jgi:hypothetical protein
MQIDETTIKRLTDCTEKMAELIQDALGHDQTLRLAHNDLADLVAEAREVITDALYGDGPERAEYAFLQIQKGRTLTDNDLKALGAAVIDHVTRTSNKPVRLFEPQEFQDAPRDIVAETLERR